MSRVLTESGLSADERAAYDADLHALDAAKDAWARTSAAERIALLERVKDALNQVAESWA